MNDLAIEIEAEINKTMRQIATAAGQREVRTLEVLVKKAVELAALKDQDAATKNRVRVLRDGQQSTDASVRASTKRDLEVTVTQGAINQSLLSLSDAVKRGRVRVGEKLTVELPSGDVFHTEVLANGKKLQERGEIKAFYRRAGVQAGDVVVLTEVTPGHWRLKKKTP